MCSHRESKERLQIVTKRRKIFERKVDVTKMVVVIIGKEHG